MQKIEPTAHLRELIELVKLGTRNIIAVADGEDKLDGIITLDDIRPIMFNPALYDMVTVRQLMKPPPAIIHLHDNVADVISKFDEVQVWNLPVVEDNKLVGFISKSSILNQYRLLLQEYS